MGEDEGGGVVVGGSDAGFFAAFELWDSGKNNADRALMLAWCVCVRASCVFGRSL